MIPMMQDLEADTDTLVTTSETEAECQGSWRTGMALLGICGILAVLSARHRALPVSDFRKAQTQQLVMTPDAQAAPLPEALVAKKVDTQSEAGGTLITYSFHSAYCIARNVSVWLPGSYARDNARYSVLYMQDGQNLFNVATDAWGSTRWQVAETLSSLLESGVARKTIVVGIYNTELRNQEYVPLDVFEKLDAKMQKVWESNCEGKPLSEGYIRFVAEELKPFIDRTFRTEPGRANTFIAGSSLGALISLHTILKYPNVFRSAACMSPYWPIIDESTPLAKEAVNSDEWTRQMSEAFTSYLEELLPSSPGLNRLVWFDHGTKGLDAFIPPYAKAVDKVLVRKGYQAGQNWMSENYPGADHNESYWQARLPQVLSFLLRNDSARGNFLSLEQ